MYVATLKIPGYLTGYLRSIIWTTDLDRADRFNTRPEAEAAIEKATKFMKKSHVKHISIVGMPE